MALFYLNLCNGDGYVKDHDGHELRDLAEARTAAVRSLRCARR